jgi:YesN/AraC family two-component response regulator
MKNLPPFENQTLAPRSIEGRILIVDDEKLILELLTEFLESKGHEVVTALNGQEGLEKFKSYAPDMILTDLKMPKLTGIQLLKAVKETNPKVPVVLISGYGEIETVVEALKEGAENFLAKPLNMKVLAKVVEKSLSLKATSIKSHAAYINVNQSTNISVPSHAELIWEVIHIISQSSVTSGFSQQELDNNLKLALVEGITNAMEHGNKWDSEKRVEVEVVCSPELLEISITDQGEGFDPEKLPDPTLETNLLSERGRGIFLMSGIMDEVFHVPPGNQLILRKKSV